MRASRPAARAVFTWVATLSLLVAACGGASSAGPAPDPAVEPAGSPGGANYTPTGPLVADAGFRPTDHGFQFENYGERLFDGSAPTNLTADDMRAMFGEGVCGDSVGGGCDLTPEAQAWMDSTNKEMGGGHCYGFSVAAELLWQRHVDPTAFGGTASDDLKIVRNNVLQRHIAYDWASQLLDSVRSKEVTGSPTKVLNQLKAALHPNPTETYTVAVWKPDGTGGHAVTPYAIEDRGGGRFNVLIYDNNWPRTTRAIAVDTVSDTWSYDAAVNPNQPDEIYRGNAKTKTLSLFPTSPGLGVQPCPFCTKRSRRGGVSAVPAATASTGSAGVDGQTEIVLNGNDTNHAHVVITDSHGRRLGYVNGKLIDEIPNSRIEPVFGNQDWKTRLEPVYQVPANGQYTIMLDGHSLSGADTDTLSIIGPDSDVSLRGLVLRHGDRDVVTVAPEAAEVSLTTSRVKPVTISVGANEDPADYSFDLTTTLGAGAQMKISLPFDRDTIGLTELGKHRTEPLEFAMTRFTPQGTHRFRHRAVPFVAGETLELDYGGWAGGPGDPLGLVRIHAGVRATDHLANEAP